MTFKPGHPGYPKRAKIMSTKHISTELRQRIPASIYIDFHLAVLKGHDPKLVEDEEVPGGLYVDEQAASARGVIPPTLEQKLASLRWLCDRQYGQAASLQLIQQVIQVDQGSGPALDLAGISPAKLAAVRTALGLPAGPDQQAPGPDRQEARSEGQASDGEPDAIDAEWSESASADQGMSESAPARDAADE